MIYLTGSHGFLGKAIGKYLENRNIPFVTHNRHFKTFSNIEFCNTVINCQAYGNHYSQTNISETIKANCSDLTKLLLQCSGKKVYNISSSSVHLKVQTPYSLTKQLGEMIVNSFNNPNFVNVRPYTLFGEGDAETHLIPTIIRHLKSGEPMKLDPSPRHDFIHVEDFIHYMFKGETEIGTGLSWSNLEIVEMLETVSGKKLNFEIVKNIRHYDTIDWKAPKILKSDIYQRLKQTYDKG